MPPRIMGYTGDAAVRCVPDAVLRYGYVCQHEPDDPLQTWVPVQRGVRYSTDCPMLDENGIAVDALDSEGNHVMPVFSTDDQPDYDETCVWCAVLVRSGRLCSHCDSIEHVSNMCPDAVLDLDPSEDPSEDDEPPEDYYYPDDYDEPDDPVDEGGVDFNEPCSRCVCVDCIAASEYTGEVS